MEAQEAERGGEKELRKEEYCKVTSFIGQYSNLAVDLFQTSEALLIVKDSIQSDLSLPPNFNACLCCFTFS